jgi:beta-N-acetylglucosaminidase
MIYYCRIKGEKIQKEKEKKMQEKKRLILIVIFILTIAITNLIMMQSVQAVEQTRSTDIDNIDEEKYTGIKQMINDLQQKHPNWNFKILYTGIEWNEVIINEYVGHGGSPRNLVPVGAAYTGEWVCESCTENKFYDNGNWRCASKTALEYMMDARNSINNSDIFQFMELTYQECTLENIKPMVTGTFLDNESYINAILEAGKAHNVSPYYIVALAIQEQGKSGSTTISGKYSGYEGYYNIFNINASGNSKEAIIKNALSYAKQKEWNSLEKAINGGVEKISTSYIARGQDTLYLQKFDVDNSDEKLYWHQYQQNIMAAQNEGVTIRKTFEEINSIESSYTFVIPVYENMPQETCKKPLKDTIVDITNTEQLRVNVSSSLNLRATPAGEVISKLYADEIVFRLEKATEKVNGTYWDKVMKENGVIGYVARETYDYEEKYKLYLVPINQEKEELPENNPEQKPPEDNPEEKPEEDSTILPEVSNEKIKINSESKQVTILPETDIQEVINLVGKDIKVTDKNGKLLEKTSIPGTGCKINDIYTLVIIGDVNGDGKINSGDLFNIQKHLIQNTEIDVYIKTAMDANKDGKINSGDLFVVQKHLLGKGNISLK